MRNFEAKSLEEVYELASAEFACSITQLDIVIVQQASKGFFGFGKKSAIISASLKREEKRDKKARESKIRKKDIKIEDVSKKIDDSNKRDEQRAQKQRRDNRKNDDKKSKPRLNEAPKLESKEKIFDNFYDKSKSQIEVNKIVVKKDNNDILEEVRKNVDMLFTDTCYSIDNIKVEFYDDTTLYIEFTGDDSALLIGKEGYRYKALSYILFNWINEKYGLMLRLEVAEFLKNQELAIHAYLDPVIETIKEKGSYKTKPLDGILVHIALKKLREEFPDKYVAVKTNIKGDKYVLVNEYRSKEK